MNKNLILLLLMPALLGIIWSIGYHTGVSNEQHKARLAENKQLLEVEEKTISNYSIAESALLLEKTNEINRILKELNIEKHKQYINATNHITRDFVQHLSSSTTLSQNTGQLESQGVIIPTQFLSCINKLIAHDENCVAHANALIDMINLSVELNK